MKSSQLVLKRLAAHGLLGQGLLHLHSNNRVRTLDAALRPQ
jgi:hypothetical protein